MHRAFILVFCALLGACAGNLPEMRPSSSGFAAGGSVLHPFEEAKRDLAAGRNGLAVRRFGEELGRQPRSLDALNGIAVAYARLGRHDVAQAYFERALELDPRDAATLNNYGRSLVDQGRLRDARPFLEQALRYAGESDIPVIASNMLTIRHATPPNVLTALRRSEEPQLGPRLVRVAVDHHQLQTAIMPAGGPGPVAGVANRPRPAPVSTERRVVALPQTKPVPPENRPPTVALLADPPRPRMKPSGSEPAVMGGSRASAPAALAMAAKPDELATIRGAIEERITSTGFGELLDDILAGLTTEPNPFPIEQGAWT